MTIDIFNEYKLLLCYSATLSPRQLVKYANF